MAEKSLEPHLRDIIGAIEHIYSKVRDIDLETFQDDLDRRRIVERNVEIISEGSRRLSDAMKSSYPEIPWKKVAGIGNILRHDYENVIPDALWKLDHDDLPILESVCREELAKAQKLS
jgi:uncharacterized protein with HEPN domain